MDEPSAGPVGSATAASESPSRVSWGAPASLMGSGPAASRAVGSCFPASGAGPLLTRPVVSRSELLVWHAAGSAIAATNTRAQGWLMRSSVDRLAERQRAYMRRLYPMCGGIVPTEQRWFGETLEQRRTSRSALLNGRARLTGSFFRPPFGDGPRSRPRLQSPPLSAFEARTKRYAVVSKGNTSGRRGGWSARHPRSVTRNETAAFQAVSGAIEPRGAHRIESWRRGTVPIVEVLLCNVHES